MYLKSLRLRGFKSFAQNTEINFSPGLNVIVGPNGCGKSNITEALRWVLGETNVRNIRAEKQEDVIFKGSDSNQPVNVALVETVLDNNSHRLDLPFKEVAIARKLFRSGDSEYYINRTKARLKDITDLFRGTGLGKSGYSVIRQGELETLITAQGYQRRLLVEEALGIIQYRHDKQQVSKKLTQVDIDLLRMQDLLKEVAAQAENLSNKAAKAEQYLQWQSRWLAIKHILLESDLGNCYRQLNANKEKQNHIASEIVRLTNEQQGHVSALSAQEQILAEQRTEIEQSKKEYVTLEQELTTCRQTSLNSQNIIQDHGARIKNISAAISQQENEIQKLHQTVMELDQDTQNNQKNREHLQSLINTWSQELQQDNQKIRSIQEGLSQLDNTYQDLRQQHQKIFDDLEQEKKTLQNLEYKVSFSEQEIKMYSAKQLAVLKQANDEKAKLKVLQSELQEKNSAYTRLQAKLHRRQQLLQQWRQLLQTLEVDLAEKKLQLQHIQDNLDSYTDYAMGTKNLLILHKKGDLDLEGFIGVLGDLISVPPGLEKAIESAGGGNLGNIVLSSSQAARYCIKIAKEQALGKVTLLPLDNLKPVHRFVAADAWADRYGVLGIAMDLLSFPAYIETAVAYVFANVLVVKELKRALSLFKQLKNTAKIVTLDGELIYPGGAVTGGRFKRERTGVIQKKAALTQQQQQIEIVQIRKQKLALQISSVNAFLERQMPVQSQLQNQISQLHSQIQLSSQLLAHINNEQSGYLEMLQKAQACQKQIQSELPLRKDNLYHLNLELLQSTDKIKEYELSIDKQKQLLKDKQTQTEVLQEKVALYSQRLLQETGDWDKKQANVLRLAELKENYTKFLQSAKQDRQRLENDISDHEHKLRNLQLKEQKLLQSIVNKGNQIQEKQAYISNLTGRKQQTESLLNNTKETISQAQEQLRHYELQQAKLELSLSALINDDVQTSDEQSLLKAVLASAEAQKLRVEQKRLAEQISNLGNIDVDAITEYEEIQERLDFLQKQYTDLINSQQSLKELLADTDRILYSDFNKLFNQVRHSFQQTFATMFPGGQADLYLESSDKDDLQAGVEIRVKLPGKKEQGLNLLSGGEKALTCLTFIFALLSLKPIPFCVFDEVDSSLDNHNLLKFSNFLKKLAVDTQLIVITHRSDTMAVADKIYGVTMAKKGVSSLVILNLNDYKQKFHSERIDK